MCTSLRSAYCRWHVIGITGSKCHVESLRPGFVMNALLHARLQSFCQRCVMPQQLHPETELHFRFSVKLASY